MLRVVLDTNVLVNAEQGGGSYASRILELVRSHKLVAVISNPVLRENELLVAKLVRDEQHRADIREYLALAVHVEPANIKIKLDDAEDVKLLEAAVGGEAKFLITDDEHLLTVGDYQGVQVIRPRDFWQWWQTQQDDGGHTWGGWVKDILRN